MLAEGNLIDSKIIGVKLQSGNDPDINICYFDTAKVHQKDIPVSERVVATKNFTRHVSACSCLPP